MAYEYNTEFSSILQQRMRYFVNDPNADTINRVRGGVAEVKNIMVENIEKVHMLLARLYSFFSCHCWDCGHCVCESQMYSCIICIPCGEGLLYAQCSVQKELPVMHI